MPTPTLTPEMVEVINQILHKEKNNGGWIIDRDNPEMTGIQRDPGVQRD